MTSDHHGCDETQVQELRHRFRNSLQVMNSLVALHARGIEDPPAIRAFADLRSRLSIVARIFTDLDEESGQTIDLSGFLPRIAHLLANQHDRDGAHTLFFDVAKVKLAKARAGLMGQILAEILIVSFRRATPGTDQNEIDIKLVDEGEQLVLTVTGVAQMLENPDAGPADKLSATIMRSLSMTLDASFVPAAVGSKSICLTVAVQTA